MKKITLLTVGVLNFLGIYTMSAAHAESPVEHTQVREQAIQEVLSQLNHSPSGPAGKTTCYRACRYRCRS